jgi:hypothetical protein
MELRVGVQWWWSSRAGWWSSWWSPERHRA